MNRGYDLFLEMLSPTFEAAELAGVNIEDAFPALVDFTAALAVVLSGGEETDAVAKSTTRRAGHWKNGQIQVQARNLR